MLRPKWKFAQLIYAFASDFYGAHNSCWAGFELREGVNEYQPVLPTFVDFCGWQSVYLQLMLLDIAEFRKKMEQGSRFFPFGRRWKCIYACTPT